MPDIFLQKVNAFKRTYFEIYTQKILNGKHRFCLIQTQSYLNEQDGRTDPEKVPLVDFTDINRDGMPDIVFYDQTSVFVYYNMHKPPPFSNSFDTTILCRLNETTSYEAVFLDYQRYDPAVGSEYLTIQPL